MESLESWTSAAWEVLSDVWQNVFSDVWRDVINYVAPPNITEELYSVIRSHREIIRPHDIRISETLGNGQFGTVYRGWWNLRSYGRRGRCQVAVKILRNSQNEVRFLQEAAVMAQFKHRNVLLLYGIVTEGERKMMVLELMPRGDLKHFLTSHICRPEVNHMGPWCWLACHGSSGMYGTNFVPALYNIYKIVFVKMSITHIISPTMLMRFSRHMCEGMEYLARKGFVHRDLAARNILLSAEYTCKIADFGMSRELDGGEYYYSNGRLIPLRWTAPEAIWEHRFSSQSDVWSYGCVLYEIWSRGRTPFEDIPDDEVLLYIACGHRPHNGGWHIPNNVSIVMNSCWHQNPSERPTFTDILQYLRILMGQLE